VDIGKRIKELRRSKNLSQEALGNALGVSKQQIYLYEKGDNVPPLDKLRKLSEVLGVSISELSSDEMPTVQIKSGQEVIVSKELERLEKENAELKSKLDAVNKELHLVKNQLIKKLSKQNKS
jgi:transcriptional regulator with XRE-family HTH domain